MDTNGTHIWKGMVGGFVATVVLSAIMIAKNMIGLMPQLDVIAMLSNMLGVGTGGAWLVHFFIGTILWGGLFALIDPQLPAQSHWAKGTWFGAGAWLLMMIIVMPMAGAGFFGMDIDIMAPVMTLLLHLIFGAVMGATYAGLLRQEPQYHEQHSRR